MTSVLPEKDALICVKSLPGILLLCRTVMSTLWETSLALQELWDHRDSFPQFLHFHSIVAIPPPGIFQNLLVQLPGFNASASSLLAEAWVPHVNGLSLVLLPRGSFSISCCSQFLKAGVPECYQLWVHSPSSSPGWSGTSGQRSLCAQTLNHDSFCDKHQLQTSQRANNLFWVWMRKKKAKHPAFTCLLFGLFHTSHAIQMTTYWVAGQDYFKFFIGYGWMLKHQS